MNQDNPYAATLTETSGNTSLGNLRNVYIGVSLVFYGLELMAAAILAVIMVPILVGLVGPTIALLLVPAIPVLLLVAMVMGFVGRIFCLSAPEENGRRLICGAVAFDVVALLILVAGFVIAVPQIVEGSRSLLLIVATILFVLFLKTLAATLGRPDLASKAALVLKLGVGLFVIMVVSVLGGIFMNFGPAMLALMLVALVVGLVLLIQYVRLLAGLKEALRSAPKDLAPSIA